jgi:hypothetical protein
LGLAWQRPHGDSPMQSAAEFPAGRRATARLAAKQVRRPHQIKVTRVVFSAGVVAQLATNRVHASRVLALGMTSMVVGLVLLVVAFAFRRQASRCS